MSLFRRNIEIDINPDTDGQLVLHTTLTDAYHDIRLTMHILSDTFEIADIALEMKRIPRPNCPAIEGKIKELEGIAVGEGFTKQVLSVLGGEKGCPNLTNLVMMTAPLAMNTVTRLKVQQENLSKEKMEEHLQEVLGGACIGFPRQGGK